MPVLDYCDTIYRHAPTDHLRKMQARHNRLARLLTGCSRTAEAMEQMEWMPLSQRRDLHLAVLMYKAVNGAAPRHMTQDCYSGV